MGVRTYGLEINFYLEQLMKKQLIPALAIGIAAIGGTTAYAFNSGALDSAAFASFSEAEQAAIEEAHEIRETAREEANAVLEAAGVTKEELHVAMHAYRQEQRAALEAALEANDYAAFTTLVAEAPNADQYTEEVFATMVEIHELTEAGDYAAARELRQELADQGIGMMGFGPGGHHDFRGDRDGSDE